MTSQSFTDFCCSDCEECFKSASQLLTHFALHASQNQYSDIKAFFNETKNDNVIDTNLVNFNSKLIKSQISGNVKNNVPDLYPINVIKKTSDKTKGNNPITIKSVNSATNLLIDNLTSKLDEYKCLSSHNTVVPYGNDTEEFSPLKFCSVTMEDSKQNAKKKIKLPDKEEISVNAKYNISKKKYPCSICLKVFGWSTDLKRHLLTHTGERPFKCHLCNSSFTRNFLLQKHISKIHKDWQNLPKMPNLNPICKSLKMNKSFEEKKKRFLRKNSMLDTNFNGKHKMNVLNLVDNGTLVQ